MEGIVTNTVGNPFLLWSWTIHCVFTTKQLQRLYRRSGHPATQKSHNHLRRACSWSRFRNFAITPTGRPQLQPISIWNRLSILFYVLALRRQRTQPLCLSLCNGPGAKAGTTHRWGSYPLLIPRWLRLVPFAEIWCSLRISWIDTHFELPDLVVTDSTKALMSDRSRTDANLLSISTKGVPVEAAFTICIVERYHDTLRGALSRHTSSSLRNNLEAIPNHRRRVRSASRGQAVHDSLGPDGLIRTIPVYRVSPRLVLPTDPPAPGTF